MKPPQIVQEGICQIPEGRQLFGIMTVKENLEMGAYLRNDKKNIAEDMEEMYTLFPILKKRSRQQAGTLSGGEQQMLAIARAQMTNPELLLMDEPSEGLAVILVREIQKIIIELKRSGISILLVEQNLPLALSVCDYAYIMTKGKIVYESTAKQLGDDEEAKTEYLGVGTD